MDTTTVKHTRPLIEDTYGSILVKDTRALAGDMGGQLSILGVGSSHEGSQEDVRQFGLRIKVCDVGFPPQTSCLSIKRSGC